MKYMASWRAVPGSDDVVWVVVEAIDYGRTVAGPFNSREDAVHHCEMLNKKSS